MEIGLLPNDHMHKLIDEKQPSLRWDGKKDIAVWQKEAREKLYELLGMDKIESAKVDTCIEVEYDKICDDLGCREIRFRFAAEDNVTIPCHLLIPVGADKPLPLVIALQGHSKGMHISLGRPKYPGDEHSINSGDRDFAVRALKEGLCAITLEQRCMGENGSNPETHIPGCHEVALRSILLGRTIIGERVWDVMRCIDVIEKYFSDVIDVEKIICLGNSGGGTTTTYAAALEPRIKISVPSCAVCRYADSIAGMLHCECNYVPGIANYFDMGDLCALCAPRSQVVINGVSDDIFPIDGAKACVDVARTVYSALGADDNLIHVIGKEGHRFYADDSWPHIHKALKKI